MGKIFMGVLYPDEDSGDLTLCCLSCNETIHIPISSYINRDNTCVCAHCGQKFLIDFYKNFCYNIYIR